MTASNAPSMKEIMEIPVIREAIERKSAAATQADTDARVAILKQIDAVSEEMEALAPKMEVAKESAEKARLKWEESKRLMLRLEIERSGLSSRYNALRRTLRQQHGEQVVVDAITKLSARRSSLMADRDRLNGIAIRIVEAVPGIRHKVKNQEHLANLAEVEEHLAVLDDALAQAMALEGAELNPSEIRRQAEAILAMVF